MYPGFSLGRLPDVGSDHFPILATSELSLLNLDSVPVPRWKIAPKGLQQISACVPTLTLIRPASVNDKTADFTTRIIKAASQVFDSTSVIPPSRLFFLGDDCRKAVLAHRKVLRTITQHPSMFNFINYKKKSAEARNCALGHKREYRRHFLQEINHTTYHCCLAQALSFLCLPPITRVSSNYKWTTNHKYNRSSKPTILDNKHLLSGQQSTNPSND